MIVRFTSRRRAGTSRKLVAVGTSRDFSMFSTILAATPRMGSPTTAGAAFSAALSAAFSGAVAGAVALGAAAVAAPLVVVAGAGVAAWSTAPSWLTWPLV